MKELPPVPSEPEKNPDKTGSKETSKKRGKKTTRIPLPVQKHEASAAASEAKPKRSLEELFIPKPEKLTDKAEATPSDKDKVETTETTPDTTGEVSEVTPAETTSEASPRPFVPEEKVVFVRQEALQQEPTEEVPTSVEVTPELTYEALDSPQEAAEAPLPESPPPFIAETYHIPDRQPVAGSTPETPPAEALADSDPAAYRSFNPWLYTPAERIAAERSRVELETVVTRAELNDATHRAEKRGVSRGVLAGGLAGWWLGRRGKRTAEREAKQAIRARDKEITRLSDQQVQTGERISTLKRTQGQILERLKRGEAALAAKVNQVRYHKAEPAKPEVHQERVLLGAPEAVRREPARIIERSAAPIVETLIISETAKTTPETKASVKQPIPEVAYENVPITEQTYQAPEGRRIETSMWHSFEIDEKTGRLAENSERQYGQEFAYELQQERLQRDAAQAQTAALLGQSVVQGVGQSIVTDTLPIPPASQDEPETAIEDSTPKHSVDASYITKQLITRTTSPMTWVAAGLLVVLLFLFGIL